MTEVENRQTEKAQAKKNNKTLKVGDIINPFESVRNKYDWLVLDVQDDKALIITKNIIETRRFDTKSNVWKTSKLRGYLNGEFYRRFRESDKSKIIPQDGADNNGDYITLLSIDEAREYFKTDEDRTAKRFSESYWWWWLRSSGYNADYVIFVFNVGRIIVFGSLVNDDYGGVRPALWLDLTKL